MQRKIVEVVMWPHPEDYPRESYVYAILLNTESGYRVVKIGATRNLYKRLGDYKKAFKLEPNLKYVGHKISVDFSRSLENLIKQEYSTSKVATRALRHLENVIERRLLLEYRENHRKKPPANSDMGNKYPFEKELLIKEEGAIEVMKLAPAERSSLSTKVLYCLSRRNKFKPD
jgi:hypothetical protein